jgi:hypothetical protein
MAEEVTVSKPDAADRHAAWVEQTSAERYPAGDDMSDLAALGETRYSDIPADEVARRVAMARQRGREWWQIAQYLGITERQARIAYGTPNERRQAHRSRLTESVADLMAAIRSALRGDSTVIRHQSRHLSRTALTPPGRVATAVAETFGDGLR